MDHDADEDVAKIHQAAALRDVGDFGGAITLYTQLLDKYPRGSLYYQRGTTYCERGSFESAIPDLTKAIELNSIDHESYANRGNAYMHLRDYNSAISDYSKVISLLELTLAHAYNGRGAAYWKIGRIDDAISDLKLGCEVDKTNANTCYNLGALFFESGRLQEAAEYLDRAAQIEPNDRDIIALRSEVQKALGGCAGPADVL